MVFKISVYLYDHLYVSRNECLCDRVPYDYLFLALLNSSHSGVPKEGRHGCFQVVHGTYGGPPRNRNARV
jgi:hypothetical protein